MAVSAEHEAVPILVTRPLFDSLRTRLEDGHEIVLLEYGEAYFSALAEAINAAQQAVFLETYIFHDDAAGRRIARALVAAHERGVKVHLVVDGFGTPRLEGDVGALLARCEGIVQVFRPERHVLRLDRRRLRRMHRKLVVIDARLAFVGGINVLDDRVDPNHGVLDAPRLDFAVQVRGPLVAHANIAVHRLWHELRFVNASLHRPRRPEHTHTRAGTVLHQAWSQARNVTSDVTPVGTVRARLGIRDNLRHRRSIERWYLRCIGRARHEITIANAYFLPGARFRRALVLAARRGVRVRLLLQGRVEYPLAHHATQALYEPLLAAGICIYEYRDSFLHAKVAVIDNHATVGSSNIDPFSLLLAREANVFVADAGFAGELRARIDQAIAQGSRAVALEAYRRRRWYRRLMQWCALALVRVVVSFSGERY